MTATAQLLDRLERAKQVRPGQWMAACPCCKSRKGRPLAVTEAGDRVLLHAFCGCPTENVLGILGLSVTDLFDTPLQHRVEPERPRFSARDVLEALTPELTFLALIANDIQERREISDESWSRLAIATQRITVARDHAR